MEGYYSDPYREGDSVQLSCSIWAYGRLKGGKGPGRELSYQRHKSEGSEVH